MIRECSYCSEQDTDEIGIAGLTLYPSVLVCDDANCLDAAQKDYPANFEG